MSSNIQKAFEKKSALRRICMADGGLVDKAKTDLGNRTAVIDAAVDGKPSPVAAKPAPAPAPAPAPQGDDAARAAVGMAPKKGMLRTLLGMAEGGHVRGPGGPREDKVPAMLSDGEYVLPAKTVQKLGGPEELDELVQQTNDGKAPKGAEERGERHSGLRKLAGGGVIEVGADGLPRTNGVSIPVGQNLATIPGEVAQKLPGTQMATIPGQTSRTIPPVQPMGFDPREAAARNRAAFPTGAGAQSSVGATPTPSAPAAVAEAAAPKPGMLRSIAGGAGNLAKGFIGGAGGAIGAATGAVQSYNDIDSGYRDKFNGSVDATTPLQTAGADTLRTLGNVGNAITFGLAGKLGQGISSATNGGSFSDGFSAPTDRDAFLAAKEPQAPAAPQAPGTSFGPPTALAGFGGTPTDAPASPRSLAQARYLAEHGVDAATQASAPVQGDLRGLKTDPGKFLNLGSFQGPDNIYGTSSKPGGRINSFVGAGDPNRQETPQTIEAVKKLNSDLAADKLATAQKEEAQRQAQASQGNSGAINARFDAMANKVSGSYSAMGKGNENKRLLEIETQRNNALEADSRNNISLRGQNQQLQIAQANNAVQTRGQDVNLQSHQASLNQANVFHNDNLRQQGAVLGNTIRQQAQAQEEQNAKDQVAAVDKNIQRRFPNANKDPAEGAKANDYQNFINHPQNAETLGKFLKGNATERNEAQSMLDRLYDQRNVVNDYQSGITGPLHGVTTQGPVLSKGDRPITARDYVGPGSLPLSAAPRYLASKLGMDAGNVSEMSSGAKVPTTELTNDNTSLFGSTKNAGKIASLQQQRALQQEMERRATMERLKQEAAKK